MNYFDEFMHSTANIYFPSIRKLEAQCNFVWPQLLVNYSISRQSIFPGKIPPCPDKRITKCTSSRKSETAPQHVRQPKPQFKTIRKVTVHPNQHQSRRISYHKACSHIAQYCACSWKHPSSKRSHTHTQSNQSTRLPIQAQYLWECQSNGQVWRHGRVKQMPCMDHNGSFSFKELC